MITRVKHVGMWLRSQTQVGGYQSPSAAALFLLEAHRTAAAHRLLVSTGAIVINSPLRMILGEMPITLSSTTMVSLQKVVSSLDPLKLQFDSEMDVLPSHHQ